MTVDPDSPFHFDGSGRTARAPNYADHVRDMIELLLFTNPMERVNRPAYGSGLLEVVFAPGSPELAATVEYTTHAALQRYLADVIEVQALTVQMDGAALRVNLDYSVLRTGERHSAVFEREVTG